MSITLGKVTLLRRLGFFFLLPLAVLRAQDYSLPYVFTTFAGASSVGAADGSGPAARFNVPNGIAIDKSGTLYIADNRNYVIRKVTRAGQVTTLAGLAGHAGGDDGLGSAARFQGPTGIVVDAQGTVYVADSDGHLVNTVRKITPAGLVTTLAGNLSVHALAINSSGDIIGAGGFGFYRITPAGVVTPWTGDARGPGSLYEALSNMDGFIRGMTLDASDNLYFVDSLGSTLWKATPAGLFSKVASTVATSDPRLLGAGGFPVPNPLGLTADAAGNIYLADSPGYVIRKITPAGEVTIVAGRQEGPGSDDGTGTNASFLYPTGVTADAAGNLFVTDSGNNTVRKVTGAGAVSTIAGISYFDSAGEADGAGANARFYQPDGVAVGPDGSIYVADTSNETIRKITPAGAVTTLAGKAGESGYADGIGSEARFSGLTDLAVDSAGNVYATDVNNKVVRKITPVGVVSTLAGKAGQSGSADGSGDTARFNVLNGICSDTQGNIYVVDYPALRKITPTGEVSSLNAGNTNGARDVAVDPAGMIYLSFPDSGALRKWDPSTGLSTGYPNFSPQRIAIDKTGQVFVTNSQTLGANIARLTVDGKFELVGGVLGAANVGEVDGLGQNARFLSTNGIAVDGNGNIYVADQAANVIRKGVLAGAPVITTQPQSQSVSTGSSVQLSVVASSVVPMTYQWSFNGNAISGATGSSYTIGNAQSASAGSYTVVVTNSVGSATSNPATLTVTSAPPPSSSGGGGGGGGGGAPSPWFIAILLGLGVIRWVTIDRFRKSSV